MVDLFSFDELEDLDITENYNMYSFSDDFTASPLCVPQDPLEDIELFPSFMDNKINLKDLNDLDWCNKAEKQKPRRVALQECNSDGRFLAYGGGLVSKKKQRSKREGKRAWSVKEVSFAAENEQSGDCRARRRCTHCETTETPQWRIGPLGPKTLCNACGVRYKSGRLLPEYRPAASPTFDNEKYSNFHKKILKKRGLM